MQTKLGPLLVVVVTVLVWVCVFVELVLVTELVELVELVVETVVEELVLEVLLLELVLEVEVVELVMLEDDVVLLEMVVLLLVVELLELVLLVLIVDVALVVLVLELLLVVAVLEMDSLELVPESTFQASLNPCIANRRTCHCPNLPFLFTELQLLRWKWTWSSCLNNLRTRKRATEQPGSCGSRHDPSALMRPFEEKAQTNSR